jgi:ferredoxin
MSRIEVARELCASTGGCEAMAPDVFEIGNDGELVVLRPEPDDADLPDVRHAVRACPTRALALTGDPED